MEIIAKTKEGCLIQATEREIKEILNSVTGTKPEKLELGQKIPAIDYAATITKIKALHADYQFTNMIDKVGSFIEEVNRLKLAVQDAGKINIWAIFLLSDFNEKIGMEAINILIVIVKGDRQWTIPIPANAEAPNGLFGMTI